MKKKIKIKIELFFYFFKNQIIIIYKNTQEVIIMSQVLSKDEKIEATARSIYAVFNQKEQKEDIKKNEIDTYESRSKKQAFLGMFSASMAVSFQQFFNHIDTTTSAIVITGAALLTATFSFKAVQNNFKRNSIENKNPTTYNNNKQFDKISHSINYAFRTGEFKKVCSIAKENLTPKSYEKTTDKKEIFLQRIKKAKENSINIKKKTNHSF